MTTGRLLFTPEPAPRRRSTVRWLPCVGLGINAGVMLLIFAGAFASSHTVAPVTTQQAVIDARIEGFRAGFDAALQQACRAAPELSSPVATAR